MRLTKEQREVRIWMFANVEDFVDECNEVNRTRLAEAAAEQFDSHHWLDDDAHWIWSAAHGQAQRFEDSAPANTVA